MRQAICKCAACNLLNSPESPDNPGSLRAGCRLDRLGDRGIHWIVNASTKKFTRRLRLGGAADQPLVFAISLDVRGDCVGVFVGLHRRFD